MTANTEAIRVFIADDHAIVREGMKYFLEAFEDFEFAGEADNGRKAVEECRRLKPDVVLMDLFMPVMNGIEATRILRQEHPEIRVSIMTSSDSCEYIIEAVRAGAVNYVLKGIPLSTLAEVVRATYNDQFMITEGTTQVLIAAFQRSQRPVSNLTQRELEITNLMVRGYHNTDIAGQLGISVSTVKNHISNIFKKLDATSRSEAVARAVYYQSDVHVEPHNSSERTV